MKKILAFLLLCTLVMCAACGNDSGGLITTESFETTTYMEYTPPNTENGIPADAATSGQGSAEQPPAGTYVTPEQTQGPSHKETQKPVADSEPAAESRTTTAATHPAAPVTAAPTAAPTAPPTLAPTTAAPSTTVRVTVREGQTLTEIFTALEQSGVCSFASLMETAQSYDYSYYPLVAKIPSNANRCFKLEGYLFPDTYEFYRGEKPQDAIGRFLRNGKAKITDDMVNRAAALGYTMDEVLTVASIIQKEGSKPSEVANVAAVIYNRLKAGQKLQMDSTIYYIERNVKPFLDGDINRYNSYYNTYKCSALPAGPIANPGLSTINAALNPSDVPYLYFCHDAAANYYYAETYEQHLENLKTAGIEVN